VVLKEYNEWIRVKNKKSIATSWEMKGSVEEECFA